MTAAQRKDLILVVDDSPDSLGMIHQALDQAGLTALIALEGQQALNIAEKMTPDLILMDAVMPNLDGFETCRRLKQHPNLACVPVIFMTGLTESEDVVRGLEAGGVDYITKPVRPNELIARIRVHLNNARMTQSAHTTLDRLGQTSFSTDAAGQWHWATPHTDQLLEKAKVERSALADPIQRWLKHQPERGQQLNKLPGNLGLRYLGHSVSGEENSEHLFRLLHHDSDAELELLKTALHVTHRESQVLVWIAHGKTNREIAQILELSPRTVNKHLEQIFRKLGVENRTAAAAMVIQYLTQIH
ncbi:LuxR family transcriptional regulator [Alcanivorax sp. 97CO-5]|jgi:DNA-binding NarL/FixJ family response regulator|uniref:response regulator transcription factor n=1 Tax=unclassified Alcanivorax TaxID=2638842 RepID=UPI0003E7DFAD|nr:MULTISPECIES: response regulator transcription factor [unclassified Alcanivorax]EUC68221.1 LuxR family transcriptional regulator [Alcanivorax sp. 97CO-5]PKG00591.1 DNA-binding response regulator [Alcanivorax sp. 97CO-6]